MKAERIRVAKEQQEDDDDNDNVVVISNITKIFRKFLHKKAAVDRVSVSVKKGEVSPIKKEGCVGIKSRSESVLIRKFLSIRFIPIYQSSDHNPVLLLEIQLFATLNKVNFI